MDCLNFLSHFSCSILSVGLWSTNGHPYPWFYLLHDTSISVYHILLSGDILLQPILASAGRDISHWFDSRTGDVRHKVDPETNCCMPYTPHGRFVHIPPPYPTTDWANDFGTPWWKDRRYFVGYLTKKPRFVRIINTLSLQEHEIEVSIIECSCQIR